MAVSLRVRCFSVYATENYLQQVGGFQLEDLVSSCSNGVSHESVVFLSMLLKITSSRLVVFS
ncbi:MAG: hypothetical protein PHQ54_05685 [Candidatus Omnitrophica bacterium]|nr:hypothetical protein [Candidatus Omnitrophota bacterium]